MRALCCILIEGSYTKLYGAYRTIDKFDDVVVLFFVGILYHTVNNTVSHTVLTYVGTLVSYEVIVRVAGHA